MSIVLNKYGEVCDVVWPVNQFYNGSRSQYACGPYGCALYKYMGQPNQGPTGVLSDIDQTAYTLYTTYIGPDVPSDQNGTNIPEFYQMLADCNLLFYKMPLTVSAIQQSISFGRPVLVSAAETGMHDVNSGDRVDYAWTPSGNHIIAVTGVDANGNLLVRDYANIASNGPRGPQPMTYDASKFGPIESVTSIVPFWELEQSGQATAINSGIVLNTAQIQAFQALLQTFATK